MVPKNPVSLSAHWIAQIYCIFTVGRDKFKYSNLAVGSYNLVITTVAACFPYDDLVYETNFTIGVPGMEPCIHIA